MDICVDFLKISPSCRPDNLLWTFLTSTTIIYIWWWSLRSPSVIAMLATRLISISLKRNESRPAGFAHNKSRRAGFIFGDYCICAEGVRTDSGRWIRTRAVVGTSKMARNWLLGPKIQNRVDIWFGPKMAKFSNVFNGHRTLGIGTSSLPCIDCVWGFAEKCPNGSHLDKNVPKIDQNC